jgi:patatin-like phospholipase/acyl hydrolase
MTFINSNYSRQEIRSFIDRFDSSPYKDSSFFSRAIDKLKNILVIFHPLYEEQISFTTSDGILKIRKAKVIRALEGESKALVLSERQYDIATFLHKVASNHPPLQKSFTTQMLPARNASKESKRLFSSFLGRSIQTAADSKPFSQSFFIDSEKKDPSLYLRSIEGEVSSLLENYTIPSIILKKAPEWMFLLENLLCNEVSDFFETNGDSLSQIELNARILKITEYISIIDNVSSLLLRRYDSLSWFNLVLSPFAAHSFKHLVMQSQCYSERLKVFRSCLEYKQATLNEPPPSPVVKGEVRVLAFRGGGMKGLTSAVLLKELEKRAGTPQGAEPSRTISKMIDIVAGTSTGAIIAAMVSQGIPADEIEKFYLTLGKRIFKGQENYFSNFFLELKRLFWMPKYAHGSPLSLYKIGRYYLEDTLRQHLNIPFASVKRELAIPFCTFGGREKPRTVLVSSQAQRNLKIGDQYLISDIVLASTSANTYFPNANLMKIKRLVKDQRYMGLRLFSDSAPDSFMKSIKTKAVRFGIDGGFTTNDPSSRVLREYNLLHKKKNVKVVTIGTGKQPTEPLSEFLASTNIPIFKQLLSLIKGPMAAIEHDRKEEMRDWKDLGYVQEYQLLNPRYSCKIDLDSIKDDELYEMSKAALEYIENNPKNKFSSAAQMLRVPA